MPAPLPPEELTQLMRFIAAKTKNVRSQMSIRHLARQFKEETGTSLAVKALISRIDTYRFKIHGMTEFDTETKVKMLCALSTPIDAGFLIELKRVADVEVDDKQRIICYKQNDGGLEMSEEHLRVSMKKGDQRNREMIQFLVEKSKTTDKPIADTVFLREFKEKIGCTDSIETLAHRYRRVKNIICQSTEIDENTKIKMIFISNAKLADDVLEELRKDADIEVDEEGKITKYKSNDGRLKLEGRVEKKRIDLVPFLIKRTKNAISPLSIKQLAKNYQAEFKSSEPLKSIESRIQRFRQRIRETNQFDKPTKVKMLFALSATIDANFLKKLQKDAIVELDEQMRIKKYTANDGSLKLDGDHSPSAKFKAAMANWKNDGSLELEVDHSLHTKDYASIAFTGERYSQSTSLSQNLAEIQKGKKRARQVSEKDDNGEPLKVEDDWSIDFDTNHVNNGRYNYRDYDLPNYREDTDPIPVEKKPEDLIEVKTEVEEMSSANIGGDDYFFEYDPPNHEEDLGNIPTEKKPESFIEVKLELPEEPSTSNLEYRYEENLDHILIEPKSEII